MKKIGVLGLFLLLVFSACRKDIDDIMVIEEKPNPTITQYVPEVEKVQVSLIGLVVDENEEPVVGAKVILDNHIVNTDNFGHFFFGDKTMNALGTLVKVEMAGYFPGSRRFFPKGESKSRVKIQLLKKQFDQSFDSQSEAEIILSSGASIQFVANSFQTENGAAYTGEVQVAAKWLDPTALATFDQMPGNLQGVNTLYEEVALRTYGMMAVELESPTGVILNIAEGYSATLSMPVPPALRNDAPESIPLWSYHEEYGVWAEEATATLIDHAYVGEVSHFSFWNCDIPIEYVRLHLSLVDADGMPLSNTRVTLERENTTTGSAYTDQDGSVSGKVPAGEIMTLAVLDICENILHTQSIGPFTLDTSLGTIMTTNTNTVATDFAGRLFDCNGDPVEDGMVVVNYEGLTFSHYVENSNFQIRVPTCPSISELEVIGVDLSSFVQSDAIQIAADTFTDLGLISVCGEALENYFLMTVEEETALYLNIQASVWPTFSTSLHMTPQDVHKFHVSFPGSTVGEYGGVGSLIMVRIINPEKGWELIEQAPGHIYSFEVTQFDTILKGTFKGNMTNNITGDLVAISGEFNINL